MKLKELEAVRRCQGATLTLKFRKGNIAIYEKQFDNMKSKSFEVIIIREKKLSPMFHQKLIGEGYTHYECYPSTEEFGKYALDVNSYERALKAVDSHPIFNK